MRVHKDTAFEFGLMPWELQPLELVYVVFVKGTFELAPRECPIAGEQATTHGEVPFDDAERPSVRCASDFALLKPRGEWLLTGAACAPGGRSVTMLPVGVKVGELEKNLVIHGDRHWERGLLGAKPSAAAAFTEMPLRWELSFGGAGHADNPSGRGTVPIEGKPIEGRAGRIDPLPNIEDPRRPIVSKDDRPPPAGAFPIPSTWPARARLLGTFDDEWKRTRWPYFPRDFDPGFYQAAPLDQRLREGHWRGSERITLRGLSPEHPVLETRLPGVRARSFVEWEVARGDPAEGADVPRPKLTEVALVLDTITIEASDRRVCCTWRGLLRGVRDLQMSNVARLFFLHEPLSASEPHAYYEDWLWRLLREEQADTNAMEADTPTGEPDTPPVAPAVTAVDDVAITVGASMWSMHIALGDLLEAEEALARKPKAADVRAALEAGGVEPPDDLVDPEPIPPSVEAVTSPSLLRLAALMRHRLGRAFDGEDLTGAPYRGLDLRGASFRGAILTEVDLRGARLDGAHFQDAVLARATLVGASLVGANLEGAELAEADLSDADLREAALAGCTAPSARFARANLERARASGWAAEGADLSHARLAGADLTRADLSGATLEDTDFTGAVLEHTDLSGAKAQRACFERCSAANLRASDRIDLCDATLVLMDAPNAQFQEAIAFRANFSGSNLAGADFSDSVLCDTNFVRCRLEGATLARADLKLAQMMQANLFEADLGEADLRETDLRSAHLFGAELFRTRSEGAKIDGADIRRTHLERR